MKTLSALLCFFATTSAFACYGDLECGLGNKCVKPSGDYQIQGICVTPTNSNALQGSVQPTEVPHCSFNSDCDPGYQCFKRSGSIYGICVK